MTFFSNSSSVAAVAVNVHPGMTSLQAMRFSIPMLLPAGSPGFSIVVMPVVDLRDNQGSGGPRIRGLSHSAPARHLMSDVFVEVQMTLRVAGLWRYPVKSLAGEPLPVATL